MLEYIRTGKLSADAEAASNILQDALADTVLSAQLHPFNYKCKHPVKGLLNPDLSSKWVTELLKSASASDRVEKGIQARLGDVTLKGFCDRFGILISHLWEESMFPLKQGPRDGMESGNQLLASRELEDDHTIGTANDSPPQVPLFTSILAEASPEIRYTAMEHNNDEREQLLEQEDAQFDALTYDSMSELPSSPPKLSTASVPSSSAALPPSCSSPPLSPLLAGKTASKQKRKRGETWNPNEDRYIEYLMTLNIKPAARLEKLNTQFPGSHRTPAALKGREAWLRKDQPATRKLTRWCPEEKTHLKKLVQDGKSWKAITQEMETMFGKGRKVSTYRAYAYNNEYNISTIVQESQPGWTEPESEYLKSLKENGTPTKDCPRLLKERFGVDRTVKAVKARCSLKRWVHRKPNEWTQEELEGLWGWCCPDSDLSRPEIFNKYWDRFGGGRSDRNIDDMMRKMKAAGGIPERTRTWDSWTVEEEEFLRNWTDPSKKGYAAAFYAIFGQHRSYNAIRSKFLSLQGDVI